MDANTWQPAASGSIPAMGWMTGSGNISYLNTNDPTTAKWFFNTTNSFCTGASLTNNPVPGGYLATAVLNLTSYTAAASGTAASVPGLVGDGTSGANGGLLPHGAHVPPVTPYIQYGYQYIAYDNEDWPETPTAEQQNPVMYMQDFITACHGAGYNVICAPGYDLFSTAQGAWPRIPSTESQADWFVRVIVGMGAAGLNGSDVFLLQNESQQGTPTYATLFNATAGTLASLGSSALVFAEVSSQNAQPVGGTLTGQQLGTLMAADAQTLTNPYPDGFYVAMPSTTFNGQAGGRYFLDDMKAAGYSA